MPRITSPSANDPVSQTVNRAARATGAVPVPLIATSYDISISGGLADIAAKRTFRNEEVHSIEATLTFPVPVHAVLYTLEAKIGGRVVKAVAKSKIAARTNYEDAIDRGKCAVLHEELLKGIHMLSVGHIAPGTEIEVTAKFALALSWIGGRALLHIPTTVGDIYGNSRLPDSDELIHGGTVHAADVKVACDRGIPILLGAKLEGGSARVRLDRPINIEIQNWKERDGIGRAANGQAVTLSIAPAPVAEASLDAAILVDHSGSMGEPCAANARISKHAAVLLGLSEAANDLRDGDRLNLWEFDDTAADLGTTTAHDWRTVIRSLSPPSGGTEIGRAIEQVLTHRRARSILLITDGKSYALDVQGLAATGARFTVVLIGEDSLEANVGHLAALSGGDIFVPDGADVAAAVRSALQSIRAPNINTAVDDTSSLVIARSGMTIAAQWHPAAQETNAAMSPAAAAYAASLKLSHLNQSEAADLAEAEGLVTHLTSLILVDEEGLDQVGLPAMRKVALPSPATAQRFVPSLKRTRSPAQEIPAGSVRQNFSHGRSQTVEVKKSLALKLPEAAPVQRHASRPSDCSSDLHDAVDLSLIAGRIDWKNYASELADGNLVHLSTEIADLIDRAARDAIVIRAAKRFGLAPRALVIALLALADAAHDRYADRVMRAILGKIKTSDLAKIADHVGLRLPARKSA
jgi:hypothetical protein